MRARLFVSKPAEPTLTGTLTLGTITKQIARAKLPNGGGDFLYFKLNDHPDLVEEGARLIAERIHSLGLERPYFVTPEASTIALAHVLRTKYGIDGLVIYKNKQINDVRPVCITYDTVTANTPKTLYLDANKTPSLAEKDIVILDSICTSGGTLVATYDLLLNVGIPSHKIKESIVLFTEGEQRNNLTTSFGDTLPLHAFSHLPILKNQDTFTHTSLSSPSQ